MENTMLIEIRDQEAVWLLKELEEKSMIRVIAFSNEKKGQGLSEKYRGILTRQQGESLTEHSRQMRSEWTNT